MAELYFSNAVATLWLEPTYIRVVYKPGPRKLAEFKGVLMHLMRSFLYHGVRKAFVDQREMAPFTSAEQEYVLQEWLPAAILQGGYRFGAVLAPQDVFARLATSTIIRQIQDMPMTYQYFDDEAQAVAWLNQQRA